jgi:hypothetical protein
LVAKLSPRAVPSDGGKLHHVTATSSVAFPSELLLTSGPAEHLIVAFAPGLLPPAAVALLPKPVSSPDISSVLAVCLE